MKATSLVGLVASSLALAGWALAAPPSSDGVGASVFAYGPPVGHTGGFGEPSCQVCHMEFELNVMGGSLTLEGLPEQWEPGRSYPVVVLLNSSDMTMAGFQLSARFPDGAPAGMLAGIGHRVVVVDSTGVPYAQHTPAGTDVESGEVARWIVEWSAPEAGGPVTFSVAANSANGDNSPFGDLIYTHQHTVRPPGA